MATIKGNRVIPNDLPTLHALIRPILRRLKTQIRNESTSLRKQASRIGISHTGLKKILEDPERISRKVMIKILRTKTKRQLVKKKIKSNHPGIWNHHAI